MASRGEDAAETHAVLHNQVVNAPTPEASNRSRRKYGWLVAVAVVGYLVLAFLVILWAPAALLNNWVPGLTPRQQSKLLGSARNLMLLSLGGVVAVVGVGISLSRHQQELEAAQRDRDRLNADRERERARRVEVDAQRNVETERTLRERFVTTVQLLSDPSPVNRQAALSALSRTTGMRSASPTRYRFLSKFSPDTSAHPVPTPCSLP